ncbi:alpha/beta hydrolase family protein [Embleya sp. AB8]|uniref:alpha/beta hydrolase family protein n=1 Tax=Embleya sp. AB8 TaxID=3156304 RepID=UPI003C76400B
MEGITEVFALHKRASTLLAGLVAATTLLVAPAQAAPEATGAGTGTRITLPPLSGRHPIGTTDLHLVDSRPDPWRPTDRRELMVTLTYPTRHDGERAAWMAPNVADVVDRVGAQLLGLPADTIDYAATKRYARTSAAVDRPRGGWPVVLFSPGFGSARELNTVLTDDLTSHGYVVAAISHPYDAAVVAFPDGRVVTGTVDATDPRQLQTALDTRVADTRFVLDQLTRLDRGENPDAEHRALPKGLAGALDLSRVGMFGHSLGGYAAGESMYHDRRIAAGINLDGQMAFGQAGEIVQHGVDRPFMLVGSDPVDPKTGRQYRHTHLDTDLDPSWAEFWTNQPGWKRDLHFDGAGHNSFSDLQVLVPQVSRLMTPDRRRQLIGTIDPTRSVRAQHDYVAAYFDLHLRGRDRGMFDRNDPCHPDTRFIV